VPSWGGTGLAVELAGRLAGPVRAGHDHVVGGAPDVDALPGTLPGRVDDRQDEIEGDRDARLGAGEQLGVRTVLHISDAVDVELEHVRRILRADAVAGAQIVIDPDLERIRVSGDRHNRDATKT
jgi:hypothetical protein